MKLTKSKLKEIIREELSSITEALPSFPVRSRVKHEDYGEGTVTHPGTKHTNVAVNFDDAGPRQVSRGSLKSVKSLKKEDYQINHIQPGVEPTHGHSPEKQYWHAEEPQPITDPGGFKKLEDLIRASHQIATSIDLGDVVAILSQALEKIDHFKHSRGNV